MFDLVHAMRTRVITNPAFGGDRVLAAILFEQTMERTVEDLPTGRYRLFLLGVGAWVQSAADEEHSESVVGAVAEAAGDAAV